jgi:DMSO/TMAO reductase YedYZ molybdopterin-dependent catalytic subunit
LSAEMSPPPPVSRRRLLGLGVAGGSSLVLGGCALNGFSEAVGGATQPLNERLEALLQGRVPQFRPDQVDPEALLINSFNGTPRLDPLHYRLRVEGLVSRPLRLDLAALGAQPQHRVIMRHVCVEGWSAIVAWSGVRLADVLTLAGLSPLGGYVEIESADQYFETWDLASALHPQTLLATAMNGAPLPVANGAPLRLATPIKLGYKLSKWVTGLRVVATLGVRRGTWEDQGYEWFAGI